MPLPARFWSKVLITPDHWLWTRGTFASGYGGFYLDGKTLYAHRLAYEDAYGLLPAGMEPDHWCRVRLCVNPSHMRPVTRKQNLEHQPDARSNSSSGVRGVSWDRARGRWMASVGHNGRTYHCGRFGSLEEAAAAVIRMRCELFTHNDQDRQQSGRPRGPAD